jgi:hypothetical protein
VLPHLQVPATQLSPSAQAWPQLPQLAGSFIVLAQPLSQQVSPAPHSCP